MGFLLRNQSNFPTVIERSDLYYSKYEGNSSSTDRLVQQWTILQRLKNIHQMIHSPLFESFSSLVVPKKHKKGGISISRAPNFERNHKEGYQRLNKDYFAPKSVYNDTIFKRRFRLPDESIMFICGVLQTNSYFIYKPDCIGKLGHSEFQKATAAMKVLAYGTASDSIDEYVRTGGY